MESNNTHKEPIGLVKEIYHDWKWCEDERFINDLKTKDAGEFAIQFHHGIGTRIRNEYGFWKGDTDLCHYFVSRGIDHADDMSHQVFISLYHYGRQQLGLEEAPKEQSNEYIQGILDCLNKLYWKLPTSKAKFIIAETSDLPNLNGVFQFDKIEEEVIFIKN